MIDWAELAAVTADINRLQGQRQAAKSKADAGALKVLSEELDRAMAVRENLLSTIARRIGDEPSRAHARLRAH